MRASYILPVSASIHVNHVGLHEAAFGLLVYSLDLVLRTEILSGTNPAGFSGTLRCCRPDDTFVRIEPGLNGVIEAEVEII